MNARLNELVCWFCVFIFFLWLKRNTAFDRLRNQNDTLTCSIPTYTHHTYALHVMKEIITLARCQKMRVYGSGAK